MSRHPGTAAPGTPQLSLLDAEYRVPVTYIWADTDEPTAATLHVQHDGQGWVASVCGWEICDVLVRAIPDPTPGRRQIGGLAYSWARSIPANRPLFNSPQNAVNAAFSTDQIGVPPC